MKKKLFTTLFVIAGLLTAGTVKAADGDVAVINVSEDAFVQGGNSANTNFGADERLIVKNDVSASTRRLTYLKFVIPDNVTAEQIGKARLSLYLKGANTGISSVKWVIYYINDDSWKESEITFNNKPSLGYEIIQVPSISTPDENIQIRLTEAVKTEIGKDRILTIAIDGDVANQKGDATFYSKENTINTGFIPQLILSSDPDEIIPQPELLDLAIAESVISKVRADRLSRSKETLENNVDAYLPLQNANGSFSDIDYDAQSRSNWEPLKHLARLTDMGLAYTEADNKYFEDESLYNSILKGYEYWDGKWPNNTLNWFYNWIAHPRDLGLALIALYPGKKKIVEEPVFKNLTSKWRSTLGRPDTPVDPRTAGANKCDIAMHWIYRSCLTRNIEDMDFAVEQARIPISFTTGEGIQADWSYRQHGAQLYLAGYGLEFIQLVTRQSYYLVGTPYTLSGESLDILSQYVRNTYLKIIRGERLNYNVFGRSISRENSTSQLGAIPVFEMLKEIDTESAQEYDDAIKRIRKEVIPSYGLTPSQTHYYRGEYTLVVRPEFTFDVRMASNRMVRSEYDYYENRQGFFLTDGGTCVAVHGDEYGKTIPLWDWTKIPGTTAPALTTMVRADSYIFNGRSSYAGGVTDGLYGVTAFDMFNDQELYAYNDDIGTNGVPNPQNPRLPALDFGAKKAWFIFDKEIVCLGAGIYSGHDETLNTTIEQRRKVGDITISRNGNESVHGKENQSYEDLDWIHNDKVAYFFPFRGNIHVANETKTAKWSDINLSFAGDEPVVDDMFTVWINHGVKPAKENYGYIIVPNISSAEEARKYNSSNIEILANNDSLQAVYHKSLGIYGLAFYKAAGFKKNGLTVEADAGCVVLIKDVDKAETTIYIADPQKTGLPINLGIETPAVSGRRLITYDGLVNPHLGKTLEFKVNEETPVYQGRDIMLDRADWDIVTSIEGSSDDSVYGDDPRYIIDGDTRSAFLFVKPGKTYNGITTPEDHVPSFTIDMKEQQEIDFFIYRHRTYNNTSEYLRVNNVSFWGKNTDEEEFEPILENIPIAMDVNEIKVELPTKMNYRYVRLSINDWYRPSGSTIQIAEFNLGKKVLMDIPETIPPVTDIEEETTKDTKAAVLVYPNPVKQGETINIITQTNKSYEIEIRDILGKTVKRTNKLQIPTDGLPGNMYIIIIKDSKTGTIEGSAKIIIR